VLFLCHPHHRYLHSFPTRRSSDLGGGDGRVILEGHPPVDHPLRIVDSHANLDADVSTADVHDIPARDLVQIGGEAAVGGNIGIRSEEHTSELPVTWPSRMPSSA